MEWENKPEVKKGAIGERIVTEILSKQGYIIYRPVSDGPHKIDFFAHKEDSQKRVICIEAKAKKRMCHHKETGFNYNSYLHYKELLDKNNIDTYVYFIDEFEECIYGNWLDKLGEGRRIEGRSGDVIVWHLAKMIPYRKLTKEEISEIKKVTQPNGYDYSEVEKYFDDGCFSNDGFYKYIEYYFTNN